MAVSRHCLLFMLNAATVLVSVSERIPNVKYVCLGDTVKMFQILDFDPCNGSISLIINGKKNKLIATWSYKHCIQTPNVSLEYKHRLFLEENGTITIQSINYSDQGKYFITRNDPLSPIQEVNIQIPVAPSTSCMPIIVQVGNKLFASVKPEDCGRPVVIPYWERDSGSSDSHDHIQNIAEGVENVSYTTCIKGPALTCEQRNQCSSIIISRSTNETESTTPICTNELSFGVAGIIGVVCTVLFLSFGILTLIKEHSGCKTKRKYNKKQQTQDEEQHRLKNISTNGTESTTPICTDSLFVPVIGINSIIGLLCLLRLIVMLIDHRSRSPICTDGLDLPVVGIIGITGILCLQLENVRQRKKRSGCSEDISCGREIVRDIHISRSDASAQFEDATETLHVGISEDISCGREIVRDIHKSRSDASAQFEDATETLHVGISKTKRKYSKKLQTQGEEQNRLNIIKVDQVLIETVAENQSGIDPKTVQLLQELRDSAYCKICYINKLNVWFMPCNHIVACSNCSDNLKECPVCRAAIEEKMGIYFK